MDIMPQRTAWVMIFTAIVYERRTENTEGNHVTKIHNVVQFTGQMNKSQ